MRIGCGFDVHRLVPHRRLVLGGVEIPYSLGLAGHSDADVLLHALADALLGAAALGDIGRHFPPGDPRYKDADSLVLLQEVYRMVRQAGYRLGNADTIIIAEQPKLAPFIDSMRERIARALEVQKDQISIKATTTEGLGFTGRGEGIAAQASVLLLDSDERPGL
ncbi:MAG: 2-C-methyl-D-erythritol 2,4-cyclodiphosphate synthase [Moorella sp. (in: firmicutes)]|jgi:2-C-methyl-D-erythritol 2,4-cyclodiphosphate synthase|uniref:2-C-methyl-D-erythritol 2,4-cyclodiphosphate synthase n=1 Tax=unclassified Neomoorella TaxID=2676739 RepID=UPI0010FFBE45|nr:MULTISPECIES: 2-C-methyl-D-erythritol 2,4-cyclodiphosphate synthase [unclassified Moorella (in: firmicutes)]MDK2817365.1 2-C-methyl-D-erythritol 2,4-cyclodiphosphate synthase [Moorella sp. (in: firmicutes)]MDK2894149.1 2-C-methyl-D-erythritol 2,4-cyclodiphosphate synthase [Moorella sp. (in: firmicutes)]GEA14426.1 2-C-methyl-D-erythritol 2,4-cyclodiphosphate synthase [Moorella sp. E308F]GEA18202.1 2-C-methyl-D-erythritol 2,4-cyclodiphosphate synthase [Moorella sp. E306M]